MSKNTYPARQRCKACRHGFAAKDKIDGGPVVLGGLYCSYRCARAPEPGTDPAAAPRECALPANGGKPPVFKKRYRAEVEVPESLRERPDRTVYRCSHCHYLHVGTKQVRQSKARMLVSDKAELGALLVKARGKATRTTVGKAAGIRPIRIKEWEEGAEKCDPAALFALLRLYRMGIEVTFS